MLRNILIILFLNFALNAANISVFANAKVIKDDVESDKDIISIKADSIKIDSSTKKMIVKGNIEVSFKKYILFTQEAIFFFSDISSNQKLERAIFPLEVKLINNLEPSEIIIVVNAEYLKNTNTLTAKDKCIIQNANGTFVSKTCSINF